MKLYRYFTAVIAAVTALVYSSNALAQTDSLSVGRAVSAAIANDPWLTANRHRQSALESQSVAASALPNLEMSVGLANMAVDSFNIHQEGMTQLKVGLSQKFGRGEQLALSQQQLQQRSEQFPFMRKNRQAQLRAKITELWLRAYQANKSIALINQDRRLFEQLVDIAESSYSSTLGKTRQQDVIRAQLELIRLDDRLAKLSQQRNNYLALMAQWLPQPLLDLPLASQLPELASPDVEFKPMALAQAFSQHPRVMAIERNIAAAATSIDVAKQNYRPQWGVNASYGYRADTPNDVSRADLFSVGITLDLPLFNEARLAHQVSASTSRAEAVKTDKLLLLQQMIASAQALNAQLGQLAKRRQLYHSQLLPQTHQQAAASLNAYGNDSGDFSDVMHARITELNTTIEALNIDIEQRILTAQLAYYFTNSGLKE